MALLSFTANHEDLSTDKGYQFKFYCDKCGNGHMTRFQPSVTGMAGGLLRAAGNIFGGVLSSAGNSAYEIQRSIGGKAHDEAFAKAIEEAKGYFKQCTRCGKWACPEVCWNAKAGLCEECAPDFEEHFTANRAQAMVGAAHSQLHCSSCGAKTTGSKFCPECGTPLQVKLTCAGCGFQPEGTPKFCPECGIKMPLR